MTEYILKAEDLDEPKRFDESDLRVVLRERLPWGAGPWRLRVLRDGEVIQGWGPYKGHDDFVGAAIERLKAAEPGDIVQTESEEKEKFRIRVAKLTNTPLLRLRELAWTLVGTPYEDLDCSAYVRKCIEHATDGAVVLAQAARFQQHDPEVHTFTDETKARRWDLLFQWFPNNRGIEKPSASHVGFYLKPGLMLDTRSEDNPVSTSPIEADNVLEYGRIEAINGPL